MKLNLFTARACITKGSTELGVVAGGFVELLFVECPGYGVRVTGEGLPTLWMAGWGGRGLPPVNGGERYNLNEGHTPSRFVTITISK